MSLAAWLGAVRKCSAAVVGLQCNRCNLQYIGETKRRLKDRFNEHRRTIDNPNTKSNFVFVRLIERE